MLDYTLLEALAAVVREGSFERAAQALHLTPSAVSQRVRLLEQRIGQVLVVRGAPCSATAVGLQLLRHVEQVALLEADLRAALPVLAEAGVGTPTLRVAVNADSLATWFVPAMAAFCAGGDALLDVSLDDEAHTAERLKRGDVLAAVTTLAAPVQGCRSVALGRLRYVACASPGFVAAHFAAGIDAAALARAPCLTFNPKDRLQDRWIESLQVGAPVAPPRHWLPSTHAFVDACAAGLGWGLHPAVLVRPRLERGELVALRAGHDLHVPLHWQHPRLASPRLQRLTDAVVAAAARVLER
ncbi:LysR family transcriptional regulator ArgP [Calidifontimicrobium sp. SYSU G02091]|uniref:LysR family transcriptional regulator ArgP n=1 Tax=Calidifontimicrobium sp. SYSU G02091 TaxID=2926421 RepID=UPI001F53D88B|nr:LysR family transcriptional regulator ArgP [Calidifontimicrobium sp. SYSU G02091]MCI1192660.1 LysR family transcriptional regulator ArgP [Calidifontimicrobium sp. SYSU G02091]